jgi:DNA-binding IclR family transcriptional regulator
MDIMPKTKPQNQGSVQVIERCCNILNTLANGKLTYSIHDISSEVNLPKPTVHRILFTLRQFGIVSQDEMSKEYSLGFRLAELGQIVLEQIDLRKGARPFLRQLANQVEEVVHLVVLDEGKILYLDKVEKISDLKSLRMVSRIGMRNYAHSCAVGKVLLAFLPDSEVNDIIDKKGLPRLTDKTVVDFDKLKELLAEVQVQGFAVDDEENEVGVRCIAAPIKDGRGKVIAAISISGPAVRMTNKRIHGELKNQVMNTALEISKMLGYKV